MGSWKTSWKRCCLSGALKLGVSRETGEGSRAGGGKGLGPWTTWGPQPSPGAGNVPVGAVPTTGRTLSSYTEPHREGRPLYRQGECGTGGTGELGAQGGGVMAVTPAGGEGWGRTGRDPGVRAQPLHQHVVQQHSHQSHQDIGEAHVEHNGGPCGGQPAAGAQGEPPPLHLPPPGTASSPEGPGRARGRPEVLRAES